MNDKDGVKRVYNAIEYHERYLKIAKEISDRAGEGRAYGDLGNAYWSLGKYQKALEYHQKDLKIAKEISDRAREGRAYGNLGNACQSVDDYQKLKPLSIMKNI